MLPSNSGSRLPASRPRLGGDDEQLRRAVDEAAPDVDEWAEHLGHAAGVAGVSTSGSASAPGQAGADDPGAEHHACRRRRPPERRSSAGRGPARATCAAAGRTPAAARWRGRRRRRAPARARCGAVGAERGDEHEQHRAGDQRLAPGVGPERERVGRETTNLLPTEASSAQPPTYSTGATASRNCSRTSAQVGPRDVPRLGPGKTRRTSPGTRPRRPSTRAPPR